MSGSNDKGEMHKAQTDPPKVTSGTECTAKTNQEEQGEWVPPWLAEFCWICALLQNIYMLGIVDFHIILTSLPYL